MNCYFVKDPEITSRSFVLLGGHQEDEEEVLLCYCTTVVLYICTAVLVYFCKTVLLGGHQEDEEEVLLYNCTSKLLY